MTSPRANLSITELRQGARHPVDINVIAEHQRHGDLPFQVINLSAHGFMINNADDTLARGDWVTVRLPVIGRIAAYLIWSKDERAGFQFERIVRIEDYIAIIDTLQPNPRLRRLR